MLTCIACTKQLHDGSLNEQEEGDTAGTPRTKHAVKTLTSQIKDIALKASGAYKNCSGTSNNTPRRGYADAEAGSSSGRFIRGYQRTGTATGNSTPKVWGKEMEARLKGLSSGASTPASVSGRTESVAFTEDDELKEWVAQVEPGVLITFLSLPHGGNDLKRIRFSREMFNKWQAQRWWSENCEKIMELYNVHHFNQQGVPLPSPPRSEAESSRTGSIENSPVTPPLCKERPPRNLFQSLKTERSSIDGSSKTSVDQSEEVSLSNVSDLETEWVEEDEQGVYITIRMVPGGARELRRVRFSRERFGEVHARLWWEQNRARIQQQYL
ncbi:hypothetical protein LXL04_032216 [Taraxacum kok-saghyz]